MVDKEKSPAAPCGGLPPPSPSGLIRHTSDPNRLSYDINHILLDNPPKKIGHRRAHSEILTLPDDLAFDYDLGLVPDGASFSDETEEDLLSMYLDMDKFNSSPQLGESSWRNESMLLTNPKNPVNSFGERPKFRHKHSLSMDGINTDMLEDDSTAVDGKKSMSDTKLAELARTDPKRAKRIWANRQSAARSKERKTKYIFELERKVQTLQTEATTLSAQLTLLQRDANCLTIENNELKLRLQTMEQQVHLQDELNNALNEEIKHLKMLTGQVAPNGSFGSNKQFYSNNQSMQTMLAAQQFQQLQIHSQKQQPQQQFQFQQQQLMQHRMQQLEQQNGVAEMKRQNLSQAHK